MLDVEAKALAERLKAKAATDLSAHGSGQCSPMSSDDSEYYIYSDETIIAAKRIYLNRRRRKSYFRSDALFGEPAWDMLLVLYINQAEHSAVRLKSVMIGSAAPQTTAFRWVKVLENEGLICSEADPNDHRVRLVRFTSIGFQCMTRYLTEIASEV